MNPESRQRLSNIALVVVAVLVFAGFVGLATRGGNKSNKDLLASETTTTEVVETTTTDFVTTTTFPIETTTTQPVILTTTTVKTTATTAKTTGTTAKTTATTKKPSVTTTTAARPTHAPGAVTEQTDNDATFTLGGSGTAFPADSATDPLAIYIKATPNGANGVVFAIRLLNNTNQTISFPGGLQITVTVKQGSTAQTFTLNVPGTTGLTPYNTDGYAIVATSGSATVIGSGSFTATASVPVDYGS